MHLVFQHAAQQRQQQHTTGPDIAGRGVVACGPFVPALQRPLSRICLVQARASGHGGCVKFLAVCLTPPAIVMEACLCSLADRISHHWAEQQPQPQPQQQPQQHLPGPSWPVVVEMLRQVAEALAFLHREGKAILHNDVRAANMLLTRQEGGGGARWKLKV